MRVGFAGLGNIGEPMARRLIDSGFEVTVADVRPERAAACEQHGAWAVSDAEDLAHCEVVALAVPDDAAVEQVVIASGLLEALAAGAIVVVHSTILPSTARALAARAADLGVGVLDAPVSGGAERAREGSLTVMVGGEGDVLRSARPVLDAVATSVAHVGPSGAGAAVKLANQLVMFAGLAAVHEATQVATHYGVSIDDTLGVMTTSTGDSWVVRNWGFFDRLADDYDAAEVDPAYRPWSKDLWDVVATARDARVQLPLAGLLSQLVPGLIESKASGIPHGRNT
jgi:3-hydroxyisobutyrate dehydrogenase-like beta-hydroxyacid dehydrogenase